MTKISMLNVGTELLRGRTINTNAAKVGEMLIDQGYALQKTIVIHDHEDVIRSSVELLLNESDVILMTGGLGPTKDDITKKVLLAMFGGEMVCHEPTLRRIEGYLSRLGRPLLEHNRQQAFVPSSCIVMENEMGTAPGMAFERDGKWLISMPGVPFEMLHLMRDRVIPFLQEHFPAQLQLQRILRTAGIPESRIAEKMEQIEPDLHPRIEIAYLPSFDGTKIELKLACEPAEAAQMQAELERAQAKVVQLFQQYVYSLIDQAPDKLLADWLLRRGKTFCTAESCTGGAISAKMVLHSGISAIHKGGIVAYMPETKINVLGVKAESILNQGIVSMQVAAEMAEGARKLLGTDYALGITGYAESADNASEAEKPQAWIALAGPNGTLAFQQKLMKDRKVNIEIATHAALIFALRVIAAEEPEQAPWTLRATSF